jgi:hypothetical protein
VLIAKWKVFFDSEQPQIGKKSPDRNLRVPGRGEVAYGSMHAHPYMGTLQASPGSVAGFWLRKDTLKIAELPPAIFWRRPMGHGNRYVRVERPGTIFPLF